MDADQPLKILFRLRVADLLELTGDRGARVLSVRVVELPALRRTVDTVLRLRRGHEVYLRHVEFQARAERGLALRMFEYAAQHSAPISSSSWQIEPDVFALDRLVEKPGLGAIPPVLGERGEALEPWHRRAVYRRSGRELHGCDCLQPRGCLSSSSCPSRAVRSDSGRGGAGVEPTAASRAVMGSECGSSESVVWGATAVLCAALG